MIRIFPNRFGIHARILSAAVALICGTTLTLGYMGVNIINDFVTQRFNQRIHFMAQYLALNSELGILIDEKSLLKVLAANMLKEDDIQGVDIQDAMGRVLVSEHRDIPGPFAHVAKTVYLSQTENNNFWLENQPGVGEKGGIGQVRVTYSVKGISELTRQMKKRFVYSALFLNLLAGIVFYFISRSLVYPVISLADTARKVSMGNRSIRAIQGSTPETVRLANAFNDMLDSLAQGRRTLVQAYEKLTRQEALAEVGKFSMMIAHEVKNPLGIIKSSLEMLKTDLDIPKDNVLVAYAEEEIVRLNDLIESFLMFSKPAKPKFDRIDLNRMVEQVIMGFEIQYEASELELNTQIPKEDFEAEADFDLLSRGIGNIIKNACEANSGQGRVDIRVQFHGNKWQLDIRDQGPGISPEDMKQIFDPFFTTKATGTGLGLAFADQVIKAHGGSIRVSSPEAGGCCFCISMFSDNEEQKLKVMEDYGLYPGR